MKKTLKQWVAGILSVLLIVSLFPLTAVAAATETVNIGASGTYALFNSGLTGSPTKYSSSQGVDNNPAGNTLTNNGYDIYGRKNSGTNNTVTIRVGCSFTVLSEITEQVRFTIYAYDVDEEGGETDTVYLVDETSGTRRSIGKLKGMDEQWNTTVLSGISNTLFQVGHTYHLEDTVSDPVNSNTTWWVYIRTVSIDVVCGAVNDDMIIDHNFTASINSSGTVSTSLYLKTRESITYNLEYSAVNRGNQRGSLLNKTINATLSGATVNNSFSLESGSNKGTYTVSVILKDPDNGNVVTSYSVSSGYSYSAVSYDPNGGSNNLPEDNTPYSSGDTVNVLFNNVPSKNGYTFTGWSTNKNATTPQYTESGSKSFVIGGSDVTLFAIYAASPQVHTHNYVETSRTEPTCTESGAVIYTCTCGEKRTEILPALHHDIATVIEREVTCTRDGIIVDRCQRPGCGYEKTTVIHGEHNYVTAETKDPTCIEEGYIRYVCTKCGNAYTEEIAESHNYQESYRSEPGVGICGMVTYTCTKCGDHFDVELPALNPVQKNKAVLLIQDTLPWAQDVNTELLKVLVDRGTVSSYNIITTTALASFDLSQYGVVMIANDQTTAMYNRLAQSTTKLENYVKAGGVLIYGACDEGWGGCGSLTSSLPGGVTTNNYYSVYNYIVDALHPIVTGVNTDNKNLKDELLKGNYCSHTYFNKLTLPEGTDIILRDANGNPTLVEYELGDGTVIASGLTWEYFYVRTHYNMLTNYSKYAFDDMITYAVTLSGGTGCAHNFGAGVVHEPTCAEGGYTSYTCLLCGFEYRDNIVPALAHHTWDVGVVTAATCTEDGKIVYTCVDCKETMEVIIPKTGHDWVFTPYFPAVYQVSNAQEGCKCANCGAYMLILPPVSEEPIEAQVIAESKTVRAGSEVEIQIAVKNNPGIASMKLELTYGEDLTLTNIVYNEAIGGVFQQPQDMQSPVVLNWYNGLENSNGDWVFATLTFTVSENAADGAVNSITMTYDPEDLFNIDEENIPFAVVYGAVNVVVYTPGDITDDGKINNKDLTRLIQYLSGWDVKVKESALDVNGDGSVNNKDLTRLCQYLSGWDVKIF